MPVENQINTLSVVKTAIKFSPCIFLLSTNMFFYLFFNFLFFNLAYLSPMFCYLIVNIISSQSLSISSSLYMGLSVAL